MEYDGTGNSPPTFMAELQNIPEESTVAVLTLLGSLCPITLAHVQAFIESRHLLLATPDHHDPSLRPNDLPSIDHVVGFISVNPDIFVVRKFPGPEGIPINYEERVALVKMAIGEMSWMDVEPSEGETFLYLKYKFPKLKFLHFTINGADDVANRRKWRYAGKPNKQKHRASTEANRFITMGRAGDTQRVLDGMKLCGTSFSQFFFMGPELPDISSTMARAALERNDKNELSTMLHPKVVSNKRVLVLEGRSQAIILILDKIPYYCTQNDYFRLKDGRRMIIFQRPSMGPGAKRMKRNCSEMGTSRS